MYIVLGDKSHRKMGKRGKEEMKQTTRRIKRRAGTWKAKNRNKIKSLFDLLYHISYEPTAIFYIF